MTLQSVVYLQHTHTMQLIQFEMKICGLYLHICHGKLHKRNMNPPSKNQCTKNQWQKQKQNQMQKEEDKFEWKKVEWKNIIKHMRTNIFRNKKKYNRKKKHKNLE